MEFSYFSMLRRITLRKKKPLFILGAHAKQKNQYGTAETKYKTISRLNISSY